MPRPKNAEDRAIAPVSTNEKNTSLHIELHATIYSQGYTCVSQMQTTSRLRHSTSLLFHSKHSLLLLFEQLVPSTT